MTAAGRNPTPEPVGPTTQPIPLPAWPGEADVAVSVTMDFDADVGHTRRGLGDRLTTRSGEAYGAQRGLVRLLQVFADSDVPVTAYVPGEVAARYPEQVESLLAGGHEIAHHGHLHVFNDQADANEQRREIERGLAALESAGVPRPMGYRAPGWELTPETLDELIRSEFVWDSSLMGDDRPYRLRVGDRDLLELPVHWSLDDWVYYDFERDRGGKMEDPETLERTWLEEFAQAVRERRHVTFTVHPECSGRAYRADRLRRLLAAMREQARVWFVTHGELCRYLGGHET